MARYAIFGDSFVSHLELFCKEKGRSFDIAGGECRFFGVPDMATHNNFSYAFRRLIEYQPDYIFVNLGANDVNDSTTSAAIVDQLIYIYHRFKQYGARRVFMASITPRGNYEHTSVAQFDKIRRAINKMLGALLGRQFIDVMKWVKYPQDFDADMVHLGVKEGGLKKLYNLIHRCLTAAPYVFKESTLDRIHHM